MSVSEYGGLIHGCAYIRKLATEMSTNAILRPPALACTGVIHGWACIRVGLYLGDLILESLQYHFLFSNRNNGFR